MYKNGEPCSACPPGTSCSERYPGLCSGEPEGPVTIRPPLRNGTSVFTSGLKRKLLTYPVGCVSLASVLRRVNHATYESTEGCRFMGKELRDVRLLAPRGRVFTQSLTHKYSQLSTAFLTFQVIPTYLQLPFPNL